MDWMPATILLGSRTLRPIRYSLVLRWLHRVSFHVMRRWAHSLIVPGEFKSGIRVPDLVNKIAQSVSNLQSTSSAYIPTRTRRIRNISKTLMPLNVDRVMTNFVCLGTITLTGGYSIANPLRQRKSQSEISIRPPFTRHPRAMVSPENFELETRAFPPTPINMPNCCDKNSQSSMTSSVSKSVAITLAGAPSSKSYGACGDFQSTRIPRKVKFALVRSR